MQIPKIEVQRELWRRGVLEWKLHEGQRRIHEGVKGTDSWLFLNLCSRQFGKTIYNLFEAASTCLNVRNSVVKYGAAFYSDLQDFIFPKAREFFLDAPDGLVEVIESKHEIVFPHHGSKIDFFGCDRNPDGARGPTVPKVILDEAQNIQKLRYIYYDVVVPMFTHTQKLKPKCIMSGTPPETPDHPFTSFFMPVAQKRNAFIKMTLDDNPLLTQDEKDRLISEYFEGVTTEAHKKVQWQKMRRELYCDILIDQEKAIVPEFHVELVQKYEKPKHFHLLHKYAAMDIGVRHKTVCLFAVYDFLEDTLHILDELDMYGPAMKTKDLAHAIKEKEKPLGKMYKRVADNNNLLLLQDLSSEHNLTFAPVVKRSHDKNIRRPLVAMVNKLRIWTGEGKIKIDPKCKELIGCLSHGVWDDKREQFAESEAYGHFDALAALVYLVNSINTKDNPIPFMHGKNKFDTYIFQEPKKKFLKIFS